MATATAPAVSTLLGRLSASRYLVPASLFLLALGLYANSIGNGFVLDDRSIIEYNPLIRKLEGIPVLFRSDY
ncbi:MAG: hypothetical protein ACE5FG_15455, partial [Myxococcota bacterium]